MFKLPYLLGPQVAPTAIALVCIAGSYGDTVCGPDVPPVVPIRNTSHRAAGPFTPRNGRVVTLHELWYRYIPKPSNWYDGTFTR